MRAPFAKASGAKRFARFAIAGTGGFAVQIAVLAILTSGFGVHYLLATLIAVEAAIVANFLHHQRWTWADRPGPLLERLWRFNVLTALTSIAGSLVLTAVFVEAWGLQPLIANVASVILLSALNFLGADRLVFRAGAAALAVSVASSAYASEDVTLQAKTARAFEQYATTVAAQSARSLAEKRPFLDIERQPAAELARSLAALKRGEVIVSRAASNGTTNEVDVDGGLINHWRGTAFIPNVTLDRLLTVLQEPMTDLHKQEDVVSSRVVSRGPDRQKVYLRIKRTKFITVVYDTEYDLEYQRLAPDRALSNSVSTRIVEIDDPGTARERALPEGNDSGYLWRLNSYWRYKQVDGGVLVEVESISLSRDLPAIVGPLIRPIVTSTARESIQRTLASVRARF